MEYNLDLGWQSELGCVYEIKMINSRTYDFGLRAVRRQTNADAANIILHQNSFVF